MKKNVKITKKKPDENFFENIKYFQNSNFNNIFYKENSYINSIPKEKIVIKEIKSDGNCFFRAISYYMNNSEDYHNNYRELAYQICLNSLKEIKLFFWSDKEEETEIEIDLENKVDQYLNDLKEDGNWASDFEINKIAQLLEVNIVCYKEENQLYIIKGIYFGSNDYNRLL